MSSTNTNSLAKLNDEDSVDQFININSIDSNSDSAELIETSNEDINIVFIPKNLHEHFECVIGENVSIDNPWTKIPHKKIIDHIQSQKKNSCFWPFRKKLEGIKNENVLVGYKPFSNTNEEFLICSTDKARHYIEETQTKIERELKQKVERSMFRTPGLWESKNSDKDIEEIKPAATREKLTYKWKIPAGRLQAQAKFEDSNSKSMKNEYVKLEPRSKETFECNDISTIDSSIQAIKNIVNKEMQTIPRIKDNKCIQSVAIEEEMFQLQPLTKPDKALDDFLKSHVPNLVNQLHYNELYDLYRDDYKLLKNENEKPIEQNSKVIRLLPAYQNDQKKYVSCYTWHPTIPGIFAVSFMANSNALYKSVNIEETAEESSKSTVKDEKYGISYSDYGNSRESRSNEPEEKIVDENYKEKLVALLNKEFVQRMRIIQVTEDEKSNEQYNQEITKKLRNSSNYVSNKRHSTFKNFSQVNSDLQLNFESSALNKSNKSYDTLHHNVDLSGEFDYDYETLNDENIMFDESQNELTDVNTSKNTDQWDESNMYNEYLTERDEYDVQNKAETFSMKTLDTDGEDDDSVCHHDSDTDSFYNIWGTDKEWLYGNHLRNTVRNIHRKFNKKYEREAREEKLYKLLKSESKYKEKKNKTENMEQERMKLTKDLFEAGDVYQKFKSHQKLKPKKRKKSTLKQNKQDKVIHDSENVIFKQIDMPTVTEQNNCVIIWSIGSNIFPKLKLESPEEVCCIEFNPRNGNTVVGGLVNGQICIWDITGKLEETIDSYDSGKSEKEKMHHEYLWKQMKWSLNVNFKTRIEPAALSAILESHDSTVTAIQWIHPMTEITPTGKLITVHEEQFSNQFLSASMDGTVKLWDLHSTPLPKSKQQQQKSMMNTRFGYPENLKNYTSPLNVYNNRLKPSYTIKIMDPENKMNSPITTLSFEIPPIQYKYISNQPLVIGKRHFEYIPTVPNDPNHILVVGNIMGQIGVVTWNGYDTHQQGQNNEECKDIWWGQMHDGPINCIKRNVFYPDIHVVSGGHIVSIWSLNYQGGPIWWKRFDNFPTSVLWSSVHPAEFLVSFDTGNVLQFWNLVKYTHQPCYTSNHLSDGPILTLSAPHSPIHFVGTEQFGFADGINETLNCAKNELISFSDAVGTVRIITVDAAVLSPDEIELVGRMFQKEVDWRRELDVWNENYKTEFGSIGEYSEADDCECARSVVVQMTPAQNEPPPVPVLTPEQIKRKICDETFKWYMNRNGPQTRLGKLKEKYLEQEKQYMIEAMMKKKNVNEKQLEEYFKDMQMRKHSERDLKKIRFEADETYRDIVNKLLCADQKMFNKDSKRSIQSDDIKNIYGKINQLLVTDIVTEKEKLREYVRNNPYKVEQEDWAEVIEFSEREVRDRLNDPTLLRNPALRTMRRKLAKKYIDEGYKINEGKNRKDKHAYDRYKIREDNINKLKAIYGKNYNPYWDKDLQHQRLKDAAHMHIITESNEDIEQSYTDDYFE